MANLARIARVMTSKRIRYISLGAALTLGALNCAEAGTINSASALLGDVTAAIASASDGDTVVVPAGKATWTSTLTITKGITLQGATTISGDHNTQLAGTPMSANDQTIIVNNVPRSSGGNNPLMVFTVPSGKTCRLTGFTFRLGTTGIGNNGQIIFSGTWPYSTVRVDHCHNALNGDELHFYDCFAVVDHCICDITDGGHVGFVSMGSYGGGSNIQGAGSYADSANWGTSNFCFFEDNTFNNTGSQTGGNLDGIPGGRYVTRYNVINGALMGGGHGLDNGIPPGLRTGEYYGNLIYPNANCCASWGGQQRSGNFLAHSNQWFTSNANFVKGKSLKVYRLFQTYVPWGGASGANAWDANDTEGNGTFVDGHSPHLYDRGTHTGANGATVLTDSTKNWRTNQWVELSNGTFEVVNIRTGSPGAITSNTNNTIIFVFNPTGVPTTFNTGDSYQIHKVLVPAHSLGRGKGDLITYPSGNGGSTPLNPRWLHEDLEPCYSWDIYNGSAVASFSSSDKVLQENRDFYNRNTSWTPGQPLTTGVAVGTLANRPTRCTAGTDIVTGAVAPGVAYWATDDGPANQNGAVSGKLYVCNPSDTWVPYYTPYQYPHPLVSGASLGPTPPSAPQNLHVVGP